MGSFVILLYGELLNYIICIRAGKMQADVDLRVILCFQCAESPSLGWPSLNKQICLFC